MRQRIRAFLAGKPPQRLIHAGMDCEQVTKAGVLPYHVGSGICRGYFMQPIAKKPHLPPPEFQICKGTRMLETSSGWRDVSGEFDEEKAEPLEVTALREGIEEIGLRIDNIQEMFDLGVVDYQPATGGEPKRMHLFAVKVNMQDGFDAPDEKAASTAQRAWMDLQEMQVKLRPDHYAIVQKIWPLLR